MNEFQSRLLYSQKSSAIINEEEPVSVSSSIYAIRFLYPGASQHTTGRIRITCTYRDASQFEAHAGVVERWTDKGWIIIDDYTDDVFAFNSEDFFRKRLLNHAHSFILGIPLSIVDTSYISEYSEINTSRKSTPKRLFDFEKKAPSKTEKFKPKTKTKTKPKDNYSTGSSKNDDDDDDLDWL